VTTAAFAFGGGDGQQQQRWQLGMTMAFNSGNDRQERGGGEVTVTNIVK